MSDAYIEPIRWAARLFPLIAALFTLPYLLFQYRRFERIPVLKVLVTYSFIFYLLAAYCLVILPLPSMETVKNAPERTTMLLTPLASMNEWTAENLVGTYDRLDRFIRVVGSAPALQLVFNVLLVLPFGIYLRYYYRRTWWQTFLMSLALSLFYEVTQLSALYGIYPKPYRVFEVDDLICNTLGGILGFLITPILYAFLPRREELDKRASRISPQVSVVRRILAAFLDWVVILLPFAAVVVIVKSIRPSLALPLDLLGVLILVFAVAYETVTMWSGGGSTPGMRVLRLRVTKAEGGRVTFVRALFRSLLLYICIYGGPLITLLVLLRISEWDGKAQLAAAFVLFFLASVELLFAAEVILKLFGAQQPFRYEVICKTRCVSVRPSPERD